MTGDRRRPAVSVLVPCTRPERIVGIAEALDRSGVDSELVVAGDVAGLRDVSWAVPTTLIEADPRQLNQNRRRMLDRAVAPIVAFLDDDAVPSEGWLETAAQMPNDSMEIWTGPERPAASGSTLAADVASSVVAEGHRAHVLLADRAVRWSEVPFCNLVAAASFVREVGLPDGNLPWDVDDFVLCRRAAAKGAVFRNRAMLRIEHDRYPPTLPQWLRRKARERWRTGEKLAHYPGLYIRVPSVVAAAMLPWTCIAALVAVPPHRRRLVLGLALASYAATVLAASRSVSGSGSRTLSVAAAMTALHVISVGAVQGGATVGVLRIMRRQPDPVAPNR